jgi:hypothetical protein
MKNAILFFVLLVSYSICSNAPGYKRNVMDLVKTTDKASLVKILAMIQEEQVKLTSNKENHMMYCEKSLHSCKLKFSNKMCDISNEAEERELDEKLKENEEIRSDSSQMLKKIGLLIKQNKQDCKEIDNVFATNNKKFESDTNLINKILDSMRVRLNVLHEQEEKRIQEERRKHEEKLIMERKKAEENYKKVKLTEESIKKKKEEVAKMMEKMDDKIEENMALQEQIINLTKIFEQKVSNSTKNNGNEATNKKADKPVAKKETNEKKVNVDNKSEKSKKVAKGEDKKSEKTKTDKKVAKGEDKKSEKTKTDKKVAKGEDKKSEKTKTDKKVAKGEDKKSEKTKTDKKVAKGENKKKSNKKETPGKEPDIVEVQLKSVAFKSGNSENENNSDSESESEEKSSKPHRKPALNSFFLEKIRKAQEETKLKQESSNKGFFSSFFTSMAQITQGFSFVQLFTESQIQTETLSSAIEKLDKKLSTINSYKEQVDYLVVSQKELNMVLDNLRHAKLDLYNIHQDSKKQCETRLGEFKSKKEDLRKSFLNSKLEVENIQSKFK